MTTEGEVHVPFVRLAALSEKEAAPELRLARQRAHMRAATQFLHFSPLRFQGAGPYVSQYSQRLEVTMKFWCCNCKVVFRGV